MSLLNIRDPVLGNSSIGVRGKFYAFLPFFGILLEFVAVEKQVERGVKKRNAPNKG